MKINAHAKINLTLDVVNRRDDGYHNVKMVMQQIELCDVVDTKLCESGITITCDNPFVPCNEKNIAYKAVKAFLDYSKENVGVSIDIQKNIPVCAGLAGGSTNASAVIIALNKLLNKNYSTQTLMDISAPLGADVPFCIMGGCALAEDIGTKLTRLPNYKKTRILLVKPPIGVSTPWAYKSLNLASVTHPDVDKFISLYTNGDYTKSYEYMGNVLESVTLSKYNEISVIKKELMSMGALFSMMSGSGPTVFGIFDDEEKAKNCEKYFKSKYDEVFLTYTV